MAFSNYPCYNKFKKSCMDCPSCPTGPIGPIGPIGPAGGPTGPTGEPGPTGPSQWVTDTIIGPTGPGYTGIGYTGDVIVRGNLYVEGGIDPTYLALTQQGSNPLPSGLDGIWIETGGSLRVQKTRLDDFSGTTPGYIDINPITNPQITLSDGGLPEINVVTLNNNQILLNQTNDLNSSLSPSAVSFTDTTSGSLGSSLTAAFLQYNDTSTFTIKDPNNYSTLALFADSSALGTNTATLSSETLTFNYGSSANFQSGSSFNVNVNNNISLDIQGGSLDIGSIGNSYNGTKIALSDANRLIELGNVNGLQNGTKISVDDGTQSIKLITIGSIEVDCSGGSVAIGDVQGNTNGTTISVDDAAKRIFMSDANANTALDIDCSNNKIIISTDNGFQLTGTSIQYPSDYRTLDISLDATSLYSQTINGPSRTATLPLVDSNNVGFQYLITNTNASSDLTVNSSGSQIIYSTISSLSTTSRKLNTGHSQIFTAIRTTDSNVYGWSMV